MLAALALALLQGTATETLVEEYPSGKVRVERSIVRGEDGEPIDHGPFVRFHENGKKEAKGQHANGLREGKWEFRFESGRIRARGEYRAGREHGKWTTYYDATQRESEGPYADGRRSGEWTFWRPDGSVDEARSGVYRHVVESWPDGRPRAAGETLDGAKIGRWVHCWPTGARLLAGEHERGEPSGPWFFFHRDDALDPDWVTTGTEPPPEWIAELAAAELAPWEPWPADAPAVAAVERFVAEPSDPAVFAALGRAAVPALLNALDACELDSTDGLARAERIHAALREAHGGRGWEWDPARAALQRERWHSAWWLLRERDEAWDGDLGSALRWLELDFEQTTLANPPWPAEVLAPAVADGERAPAGSASGERFGGRFGGPKSAVTLGGKEQAARREELVTSLARAQRPDGCWSDAHDGEDALRADAWALLALVGEGSGLYSGEWRDAVRRATRHLLAVQDAASGAMGETEGHLLATWALLEVDAFSSGRGPRRAAGRALEHMTRLQREDGSFVGARGLDLATAAAGFALAMARAIGLGEEDLAVPALGWLERRADEARRAAAPERGDVAVVGSALFVSLALGRGAGELAAARDYLSAHPPEPDSDPDELVFGTWAAYQAGRPAWIAWYEALGRIAAAPPGDEVERMAKLASALQVYYRYAQMTGAR